MFRQVLLSFLLEVLLTVLREEPLLWLRRGFIDKVSWHWGII